MAKRTAVSVPAGKPQPLRMAAAILEFLAASGLDLGDPQLAETPSRVAQAWIEDYLDGYAKDPAEILGEKHPVKSKEMVIAKSIDFHSMCPHHLVPYRGLAHVAYLPKQGVVGFGKLVELVDCYAHRLVLQEQIAEDVSDALMRELGAAGAACILDAEQACMTTRGPKRRNARTVTQSFKGSLAKDRRAQERFLAEAGRGK